MIRTIGRYTVISTASAIAAALGLITALFLTAALQDARVLPQPASAFAQTLDVQTTQVGIK